MRGRAGLHKNGLLYSARWVLLVTFKYFDRYIIRAFIATTIFFRGRLRLKELD